MVRTLSKKDIIRTIAVKKGVTLEVAHKVVYQFLDELTTELSKGNHIQFRGFGSFDRVLRKGNPNPHNPRTGEPVAAIPDYYTVRFRPRGPLRDLGKVQSEFTPEHTN